MKFVTKGDEGTGRWEKLKQNEEIHNLQAIKHEMCLKSKIKQENV